MSGARLLRLELSHFRSWRHATIAFDGRPVVIRGANGSGKTNLLEAVSLLSPGRGLRGAGRDELMRRPEQIGWKISALVDSGTRLVEVETGQDDASSTRHLRIDGKARTQISLGGLFRVLWLVPAMDRLWIEPAEGRRRFLDRLTMSFEPGHGEAVLAYERAMRERNRLMRDQTGDARWYGLLERRMAEAGAAIIAARARALDRLARAQSAAGTAFPAAALSLQDPEPCPQAAPDLAIALAEGRRRDMAAGRSLTGPHRVDLAARYLARDTPAAQCSTGEQKALLVSLILANARALAEDTGAAPILLMDEVAAHLDPSRRAALFDEICTLGAQALLTGTEPELFAGLGLRAMQLETGETAGASAIVEGTSP